jgi:hypothetical protein
MVYLKRYTDRTSEAMKPASWQAAMTAAAMIGLGLGACTPAPPEQRNAKLPEDMASGWSRTPQIDQVRRDGGDLVFAGVAEREARVVLRDDADAAFAAVADNEGRFEIRMTAPRGDLWLKPETQSGQMAAVSPDLLVIIAGGQGPVVLLRPGAATRRLAGGPALAAVDSDGRIRRLSGRAPSGSSGLEIAIDGASLIVMPDSEGRWNAVMAPDASFETVKVDGRTFAWPGDGAGSAGRSVERAGEGWRIHWPLEGGRQTVWLPDATPALPLMSR